MSHDARWAVTVDAESVGIGRLSPALTASQRVEGAWTIVTIAGEMDLRTAGLLGDLPRADARHQVFDLGQVTFMDTGGLDLLVRRQRDALRAGGCVRLVAPSRKVRRVLMLTGANREFTTFASADDATSAPVRGIRRSAQAPD